MNTACCVLMLIAKVIQCIVFGPLRVSEKQVSSDCWVSEYPHEIQNLMLQ